MGVSRSFGFLSLSSLEYSVAPHKRARRKAVIWPLQHQVAQSPVGAAQPVPAEHHAPQTTLYRADFRALLAAS